MVSRNAGYCATQIAQQVMTIKAYSEKQIRQMRAAIYGDLSDESWEKVRDNWMRRIRFNGSWNINRR